MSIPKLSPQQLERIRDAILDGFRKPESLIIPLRFKWGLILEHYFDLKRGTLYIVSDLVEWTERRGKTRELMLLAYYERPHNRLIKETAESLGISLTEAIEKYGPQNPDVATQPSPLKPALEAMVVANSRAVDFASFLNRFRNLGDRICRVETPTTLGTGFLVGPNLVLTNFRVVEPVDQIPAQTPQTICRFDYHAQDEETGKANGSKACRLAAEWLVAKSPYSPGDKSGIGEARLDELGYALLRLAEDEGNQSTPRGDKRGWFDLDAEQPLLAVGDFALVPHAQGRQLEVVWGSVTGFNASSNRVRYDTRTEEGSSGSPCFTADLELFGLHQATDPEQVPKFNQAIPLNLIAMDLKGKGIVQDVRAPK